MWGSWPAFEVADVIIIQVIVCIIIVPAFHISCCNKSLSHKLKLQLPACIVLVRCVVLASWIIKLLSKHVQNRVVCILE
jgi:hypothetical protein